MIATKLAVSETRILLEYEFGYMKVGVPNAYTIQMIHDDFSYLNETWDIYPAQACRRLIDGTIVHNCTTDYRTGQLLRAAAETVDPPANVIEDRGRGSEINSVSDQGKLLQYLSWAQLPLDVGVIFPTQDGRTYEFWMELVIQHEPDDGEDPLFYLRVIKAQWLERLMQDSPYVARALERIGEDFGAKMRYCFNRVRVWFVPNGAVTVGFKSPLAEASIPKDKWYSPSDLMAFSIPPLPDDQIGNLPSLLCGPGAFKQDRYVDPEVQGGRIALIAIKQMRAQKPLNFLDRMQSTYMKQVAFNQRIIAA
jgi:hypothetical protein